MFVELATALRLSAFVPHVWLIYRISWCHHTQRCNLPPRNGMAPYSQWGSNPRPMAHKTIALTTELEERTLESFMGHNMMHA